MSDSTLPPPLKTTATDEVSSDAPDSNQRPNLLPLLRAWWVHALSIHDQALGAMRRERANGFPALARWWAVDEPRLGLFIPVLIGMGIGAYFALPEEPTIWNGMAMMMSACLIWAGAQIKKSNLIVIRIIISLLIICIGFNAAIVRTHLIKSPMIEREVRFVDVTAKITRIENRSTGWRLTLEPRTIEDMRSEALPRKIRISWRGEIGALMPGDVISLRATLSPPPPPVMPGEYDFGRHLFFQQIGGVGFAVSTPQFVRHSANPTYIDARRTDLEKMRMGLFSRIRTAAPGQGGGIVAAIVTGKREAIEPQAQQYLRDSGLAHLLAISGLHMGLATGLVFFGLRYLLALNQSLALKMPIKKWAAVCALMGGLAYLLISGSGVSAQRAFMMTSIVFLAILTDRRALSLRNVAIAATLILLFSPEALLHPGFQMSFAAVTALIAAYEWYTDRRRKEVAKQIQHDRDALDGDDLGSDTDNNRTHLGSIQNTGRRFGNDRSWGARLARYTIGVGVTDTIAAGATAPFALYHFQRTALYSLPANLLAMPIMAFWIMPAIIGALILMPLGLDGYGWRAAASGVDIILNVGGTVSDWPGAVSLINAQPASWIILATLGGCVLLLLRAPWRFVGLAVLPVMAAIMMGHSGPDILITNDGRNSGLAVQIEDTPKFLVLERRRGRFAVSNWMEHLGFDPERDPAARINEFFPCDQRGCVINGLKGMTIAISRSALTLAEDCHRSDLVIAHFPVNRQLKAKCDAQLIDRRDSWNNGAHALWITKAGQFRVRTVNERRSNRPWGG